MTKNTVTINSIGPSHDLKDAAAPNYQTAHSAYRAGNWVTAEEILHTLLRREPRNAHAHHLLGMCYSSQSRWIEAESAIRNALEIVENAAFYADLGRVLRTSGNAQGAITAYEASLKLEPRAAIICNNLANILTEMGRLDDSIELYNRAIINAPEYALAYKNLGMALLRAGRRDEAEAALRRAIALKDDFFDAQKPLAYLLVETGRADEALTVYKWWGLLQFEMRTSVVWENLPTAEAMYLRACDAGLADPLPPFRILYIPQIKPEIERQAGHAFATAEIRELQHSPLVDRRLQIPSHRPLRVGYASSDFYNHATMHLLAGVLEAHDRTRFRFEIFSYGSNAGDEYTRRLVRTDLPISDISNVSNYDAAKAICERQIDILVDLKGYTGSSRLGIAALRPAPIIVNWLGYPGTLGHERLADYIIGDGVVTPPENVEFYSERLALMPHCYQPNDRLKPLPHSPARSDAGLPRRGVVFCSFNQPAKYNSQAFDIWTRLLKAIQGSVLWLLEPASANIRSNIVFEFQSRGITPERIIFAPFASQADHIARLRLADLALDTFPCTSHTTGSDALWCGVPLVTMKGKTFASRVAASLLTAHGFPELVTENEDDYFNLALELATNEAKRATMKARLEQARTISPLFDTARFTKDLEKLYRAIVENHNISEEQRPRIVTVG